MSKKALERAMESWEVRNIMRVLIYATQGDLKEKK